MAVSFFLYLLTIPVALAVYIWFDEPSSGYKGSSGDEKSNYSQEIFALVRQRRVLMILLARPLPVMVYVGFFTYNSVLVVRLLNGTPAKAGIFFAMLSVVAAGSASQAGRVMSLMGDPYRTLLVANTCLGCGLAVVFLAPDLVTAGIGVIVVGTGFGIIFPLYRTLITGFAPESLRAGLVSIGSTSERLSGIVTPIAMGGAIASLTPMIGFVSSIQTVGLGIAIMGGGVGIICTQIARTSPIVPQEQPTS